MLEVSWVLMGLAVICTTIYMSKKSSPRRFLHAAVTFYIGAWAALLVGVFTGL